MNGEPAYDFPTIQRLGPSNFIGIKSARPGSLQTARFGRQRITLEADCVSSAKSVVEFLRYDSICNH